MMVVVGFLGDTGCYRLGLLGSVCMCRIFGYKGLYTLSSYNNDNNITNMKQKRPPPPPQSFHMTMVMISLSPFERVKRGRVPYLKNIEHMHFPCLR